MNLNEKLQALAAEHGVSVKEICPVIGMTEAALESALGGDEKNAAKAENFFADREEAFRKYGPEQCSIIRRVEKNIIRDGSSQKLCHETGISAAVLSALRRGKYSGNLKKQFSTLADCFQMSDEKQNLPEIFTPVDYAPTSILEMICASFRTVHLLGGCAVITGDAGIGKTKAIQKYARDHSSSTIVITADVFNHTASDMLFLLGEQLGISETGRSGMKKAVFARLHGNMMIIVDEAQELNYQAANALRAIPDRFEKEGKVIGLAFVGNPCFYDMFRGRYASDRVQVSSRFVTEHNFSARKITADDTRMLYPVLTQQNMTKELMFLHAIATTPSLGQRKAMFLFMNAYNRGKYDLDALVQQAKESNLHFDNLNEVIAKIRK